MKGWKVSTYKAGKIGIGIVVLMVCIIVLLISCGKLKEDEGPSYPIGTSGGREPLPPQRRASVGTYTLSLSATPNEIPADMATYSIIIAELEDTSGRTVANFTITFISELGYLENDPLGPSSLSQTVKAVTGKGGKASVYLYASRAGSENLQATADINQDGQPDLYTTVNMMFTPSPGVPGPGIAGIDLVVDPTGLVPVSGGTCAEPGTTAQTFNLTAYVWDETGDRVGPGVRVELSGDITPDIEVHQETGSDGTAKWTISYDVPGGVTQTYMYTITATVIINGVAYTDTVTYGISVTCGVEPKELEVEILPTEADYYQVETGGDMVDFTVRVLLDGRPLQGATISFTVAPALGTVTALAASTDSFGLLPARFTSGNVAGVATIYANVSAVLDDGSTAFGMASQEVTVIQSPTGLTIETSCNGGLDVYAFWDYYNEVWVYANYTVSVLVYVTGDMGQRVTNTPVYATILPNAGDTDCGNFEFVSYTASGTTDVAGRAQLTWQLRQTATTSATEPCSFAVELVVASSITRYSGEGGDVCQFIATRGTGY